MKINGNEIKFGNVIMYQDMLWVVVKVEVVKLGKGGVFVQVELKNLFDGCKFNECFCVVDKVECVCLEQKDYIFLFDSGEMLIFMDVEIYEQIEFNKDFVGEDWVCYLQDGMMIVVEFYEDCFIGLFLLQYVLLEIIEIELVIKGQMVVNFFKLVILENGVCIVVLLFIVQGECIVVVMEDGFYVKWVDQILGIFLLFFILMMDVVGCVGCLLNCDFCDVEYLQVFKKGFVDFVFIVDKKVELIIYDCFNEVWLGYGFFMEEGGVVEGIDKFYCWIIDLLDGMLNFLYGMLYFVVFIVLECEGELVVGVVYNLVMDEMFYVEKGCGVWLVDCCLCVVNCKYFDESVVVIGMLFVGKKGYV